MSHGAPADERSAGGVVIHDGSVCVIVPRKRTATGSRALALPKGHLDAGETAVEAATREVREETGLICEPVRELGEVRYRYRRGGRTIAKAVVFFEFRLVGGSLDDHDDEVEDAAWLAVDRALEELTFEGEREMVRIAVDGPEAQ